MTMNDLGRAAAASPGVMRWARRAVRAAALGGGGIGAAGALGVLGFATFVSTEIARVRRLVRAIPTAAPPRADAVFGPGEDKPGHSLVLLGDSTAAGLGVHLPEETPGALLATSLARLSGRRVALRVVAHPGADSTALGGQVTHALEACPDVAVIMIGANDVKNRIAPSESVLHLDDAVRRLRASGAQVIVGTCPDLGTVQAFSRAGRGIARLWSRRLATAQTVAVLEAGGRTVSLGDLLGPEFRASPTLMFSEDRFHPSAAGYAAACRVLEPAVANALGHGRPIAAIPVETTPESVATPAVVRAAATAVANPGTVVVPDERPARPARTWGVAAMLRRLQEASAESRRLGGERVRPPSAPSDTVRD